MTATSINASAVQNKENTDNYIINQKGLQINTLLPCKINVINDDGTYDVTPMLNNLYANGKPIDPPTLAHIPAAIEMGGNAGIIIEYEIGDVVLVGFCQRDISIAKKNWEQSNPGSLRRFSLSDGIIIKRLSNTPPTVFIKITKDGIELTAPGKPITLNAASVQINAPVTVESLTIDGQNFTAHRHSGGTNPDGNTGSVLP